MYQYIYYIIFILINPQYFGNIEQKNKLKAQFNAEYKSNNFFEAKKTFEKITKITTLIEPELRLNAGNVYFNLKDTLNARINYEQAINSQENIQSALAFNQLGTLAITAGDTASGLDFLKKALAKKTDLKVARFNYELIKSIYKPKTSPPPPQAKEDIQQGQVEASNIKETELETYKPKNMSKERALQLLEDLKNSEKKIITIDKNTNKKIEKDW